jgi:membrane protein YqaA with SNARE-associated domain
MSARIRDGACAAGGILGYPLDRLYEEVAYIAFHFHWSAETLLNMEHAERRRWAAEITRINEALNKSRG